MSNDIQPSRVILNLQKVPVMIMDVYTNFYWMDPLPNGQYKFTNIPMLKNVAIQEETTTESKG